MDRGLSVSAQESIVQRMKILRNVGCRTLVVAAAFAVASATPLRAAEPTAFELIKEANRYVGEQAKDKVVQVRSEKSIGSLTPNIWYIVLYDPTATMKAQEVKFGAGKML